jgi:adenylate kinase family enzyme
LIDYYTKQGKIINIDAKPSIEEISNNLKKALGI